VHAQNLKDFGLSGIRPILLAKNISAYVQAQLRFVFGNPALLIAIWILYPVFGKKETYIFFFIKKSFSTCNIIIFLVKCSCCEPVV
jgi:hypothetical protein